MRDKTALNFEQADEAAMRQTLKDAGDNGWELASVAMVGASRIQPLCE